MKIPATAPRYLPRWLRHGIVLVVYHLHDIAWALHLPRWITDSLTRWYLQAFIALWDHRQVES